MRLIYITMSDMAKRYGYTLNGIKLWIKEGLPFDEEKKKIPEIAGTAWILENKINPLKETSVREQMDKEKLREQKAKADIAQMSAAKEAGALIETDYVQAALDQYLSTFKDVMRSIPRNYVVEILEAASDSKTLKEKLNEIINESLTEIGELLLDKDMLEEIEQPEVELGQHPDTDLEETEVSDLE
ncbi:hypothetical protein [Serratia ureilytica]|uniref:hypothetical protein n=1 Tax=Serratia ureilytica TaxID=300181 RepID=UPI0019CFEFC9|nr:hypothetical protein [Serratia ureilytica]MBN5214260.1 hypothetical protein [Serratia ureilytica]